MSSRLVPHVMMVWLSVTSGCHATGRVMVEGPRAVVCGVTSAMVDALATGQQEQQQTSVPTATHSPARRRITGDDVERMEDLFDECRYEQSLAAAEDITAQITAKSKYRAKAWFYKGVILVLRSQENEARECFRQARRLDDDLEADRHQFKPAVVRCFQSASK